MRLILYPILSLALLSASFLPLSSLQPAPKVFRAKVVKIIDGDTFDVLDSINRVSRIRMNGIDAPEKNQAFGTRSRQTLSGLCFGQQVLVRVHSLDRNKRLIADTYANGRSLSLMMVTEGMAWHFKKYSTDTVLANAELRARSARRGLWADASPQAPWDFRAAKRNIKSK